MSESVSASRPAARPLWIPGALFALALAGAGWGASVGGGTGLAVVALGLLGAMGGALWWQAWHLGLRHRAGAGVVAARQDATWRTALGARDGVVVFDDAARILEANEVFCRAGGFAPSALRGETFAAVRNGRNAPDFFRDLWRDIRAGRPWHGELVAARHDGSTFPVAAVVFREPSAALAPGAETPRYVAVLRDLSGDLRAADELERFRQIARQTTSAIWTMDREYRIEWVNPAFEALTGFTRTEAIGRRPGELLHGPETAPDTLEYIDRQMEAGQSFEVEIQHFTDRRRTFWGHVKVSPVLDEQGRVFRWVAVEHDITAFRRRDHLQSAILASAAYAFISSDENGVIETFNRGAEVMLGYRADELLGKSTSQTFHDPSELARRAEELSREFGEPVSPGFETIVAKTRRTGRPDENEWTFVRKDGSRLPVRLAVTALRDANGSVTGYLGIASDITAQRQSMLDLQASEGRLREAQHVAKLGSWEVDVSTRRMRWSEEAARLLGVYPHLSSSVDRALALYLGPDRQRARDAMTAAFEQGTGISFEASMRALPNREIRVRVSARTEQRDGRVVRVFGTTQDITELHEAEQRRRELTQRLEKIAAQVPGMVFQFKLRPDGSSCFPYASSGIRDVYRVTPEDVVDDASKVFGVLHHLDLERVGNSIYESARTLSPWICEYRVQFDDGTVRWLLGNSIPEREADGSVLWHGYICDITARKQIEEQTRRGEERFSLIASATSDAVWDYDPQHATLWWSDGITRLFGYARPEPADGMKWWAERIHPEDSERAVASFATALENNADRWEEQYRFRHADGRWLVVHDRAVILRNAERRAVRALGGMMDVSARHEAEAGLREMSERLHLATQVAHIGVWDSDLLSDHQIWDRRVYEIFGLDPEQHRADNATWRTVVHPDDVMTVESAWRHAVAAGIGLEVEYRIRRPDGSTGVVRALGTVQRDSTGRAIRMVGVNSDVTHERQAAAQILAAKEAAEAATRAKSEFLANMSHEIRTPLNAVIGMSGLLLGTSLDREQREFGETIRNSGDTLLALLNDILDFSKIESGSLELEQQPFDLRECVESSLDLLAMKAAEKQIDLLYWISPAVPPRLLGDVTRLRQILANLVSNAVKFTAHGEVCVNVELAAAPAIDVARTRLHVTVRDTGIGIPADRRDRLFKSFSQVDASTTRKFGGTGLGLAISKRLVELMHGHIWVESIEGQGTTFHFEIEPAITVVGAEPATAAPRPATVLAGRRVLVVDDNTTSCDLLCRHVRAGGGEPVALASAAAALAWAGRDEACDLALIGLRDPQTDVAALARQLRRGGGREQLRIVLLVAIGSAMVVPEESAITALVSRPVKFGVLQEEIARLFGLGGPATDAAAPAVAAPKLGVAHPLSILLTEDHVTNQRVAQLLLGRLGYRADVANNGLECLGALERRPYDVVLMDVQMPEMDGLTASREINQRIPASQRPYIVAMTANAMQGDRDDCAAAGMDDYVAKPVQLRELEAALRRAITARSARGTLV